MTRVARATAAALLAASLAIPASGHGPDPFFSGGPFPQNAVLEYRWSANGSPPADARSAIHDARDDSNASKKSKAPTFAYDAGASNAVYYGADVPCGTNGLACFRRNVGDDWFGVWMRPNGHRFDWGTLRWCELSGSPDGCYEIENVMLDELGHVLGLDHHVNFSDDRDYDDAVVQTYSRTKPRSGWNAHVYGRCDVATLQQQYDVATWSTLYSTCLDVPTVITLAASTTSASSGSMVTFTASLRSDGSGRLSNNPMSGRTVVLQRRTSTSWSDLVTMTPGSASGTYVTGVTVRSTADYRALFRTPSNEGVTGDSSPAKTVSVTSTCTGSGCPQSAPATTR